MSLKILSLKTDTSPAPPTHSPFPAAQRKGPGDRGKFRRIRAVLIALLSLIAISGCTLTTRRPPATPVLVTATLPEALRTLAVAQVEIVPTDTPAPVILPSATPIPSATTTTVPSTETPIPAPPSVTPLPLATLVPASPIPTRTAPVPTAPPAIDDGSGRIISGTGGSSASLSPVAGVNGLPETLYYLSDAGGLPQVWRLPVALNIPEQMSFSATGVKAFDISATGRLAYIGRDGMMIVDGIPFTPPAAPDGTLPQVTALAWSPGGNWLAYTLSTPGAAEASGGAHAVDGLWIRSIEATTVFLQANQYHQGETQRIFAAPIRWRPDGTEVLAASTSPAGISYNRVNITTNALITVWTAAITDPAHPPVAVWSINGNAIIASGAGQVLRIEPDSPAVPAVLLDVPTLSPTNAQQFANGTITFLGADSGGIHRLYLIPPGAGVPQPVTEALSGTRADFLWDNFGEQTLIVTYGADDAPLGTAYLRDAANTLYDLTPLTGVAGSPVWGPIFRVGDKARVHTTRGETLNIRSTPGGDVVLQLVDGSQVTVVGEPRQYEGYRWWKVQTADGIAGWAVESVEDERGLRLRTLTPIN